MFTRAVNAPPNASLKAMYANSSGFAFGVMTRAKAITYDNLRLRAPDFVAEVDRTFANGVQARGFDVNVDDPAVPMFQPMRLRDMVLQNRVVMSAMDM